MRDCIMVVGSGMMGSGIGAMSALAGNRTILVDVDEAHVRSGMEKAMACIDLRVGNGLNTAEEAEEAKKRMETSIDMLKAAASARMVIEAVVEQLEVKQALFAKLDEVLPVEVPICSNTSGLRITDISGTCKKPERTVTTHFWLPAHLVPLVEVVMGELMNRAKRVMWLSGRSNWSVRSLSRVLEERRNIVSGMPCRMSPSVERFRQEST